MLEQERGTTAGALHHPVGDLAQLQFYVHRLRDPSQLSGLVQAPHEVGKRIDRHAARSPWWSAAMPNESERQPTLVKPAARISCASCSTAGKLDTESGR